MPVVRDSRSRSRTQYAPRPYFPHPLLVAHGGRTVAVPRTPVYMQTLWNIKTSFRALQGVDVSRLVIKSRAIPGCEGVNAEVSAALWPGVANKIGALEIVVDDEGGGDEVNEEDVQSEVEPSEMSEEQSEDATPVPESEYTTPREPAPAPNQEQIFVKTLTGRTLAFYVDLSMPTQALEAQVALRDVGANRSAGRWCLSHAYSGAKLLSERTLFGNNVRKESTLQMVPQYGSAGWWPLDPTGMARIIDRARRVT